MGRLISGINGPVQGKIGTVIGSSWKGIPYLKGPYSKRTGKAGPEETGNRNKFAQAHFWLRPVLGFVRVGLRGYAPMVEGFNAAKSLLLRYAFEGVQPDMYINPALARLSAGTLALSGNMAVVKTAPGQLAFSWDAGAVIDGHAKDQVMMLAYDVEHGRAYYNTLGQFRNAGADVLNTDPTPGKSYHVYGAFVAADRSRQSDSVYLGMVTM